MITLAFFFIVHTLALVEQKIEPKWMNGTIGAILLLDDGTTPRMYAKAIEGIAKQVVKIDEVVVVDERNSCGASSNRRITVMEMPLRFVCGQDKQGIKRAVSVATADVLIVFPAANQFENNRALRQAEPLFEGAADVTFLPLDMLLTVTSDKFSPSYGVAKTIAPHLQLSATTSIAFRRSAYGRHLKCVGKLFMVNYDKAVHVFTLNPGAVHWLEASHTGRESVRTALRNAKFVGDGWNKIIQSDEFESVLPSHMPSFIDLSIYDGEAYGYSLDYLGIYSQCASNHFASFAEIVEENETCGTNTNGPHCHDANRSKENRLHCCSRLTGSSGTYDAIRDIDWFILNVHAPKVLVRLTSLSEAPIAAALFGGQCLRWKPGVMKSSNSALLYRGGACSAGGTSIDSTDAILTQGEYFVGVGLSLCNGTPVLDGYPCGSSGNATAVEYEIKIECFDIPEGIHAEAKNVTLPPSFWSDIAL